MLTLLAMCLWALQWGMVRAAEPVSIVLVAHPGLTDPNFSRSVVLVTRTPGDETIGVILNRRLSEGSELTPLSGDAEVPEMYFGGPLVPRGLIGIGTTGAIPESQAAGAVIDILPGYRLVVGTARVRAMLQAPGAGRIKVFAGYAGWAPGQLEQEIARGGWIVLPASDLIVFDAEPDTQWERLSAPLRAVGLPRSDAWIGAPLNAPGLQRLLGAQVLHAVDRTHVDVTHVAALQHLERNRDAGAAAGP